MKALVLFLIFACCGTFTIPQLCAQDIVELSNPDGGLSVPLGINNSGQVAGWSTSSSGNTNAFLYSDGTITDLGTLSGDTDSYAYGINNLGQVVGNSQSTNGTTTAFIYSGGIMTSLGTLGGSRSQAQSINDSGQVVGTSRTSSDNYSHAFIYSGTTMTDLGALPGSYNQSSATSINSTGQVAGYSLTNVGFSQAFLYSDGVMTDLGTLGGSNSIATGINNLGQVAGWSTTSPASGGNTNAFLYSGGKMTNLGTLGGTTSYAYGINNSGQVVGYAYLASDIGDAFIYSSSTGMQDLNTLYASMLVSGTGSQKGFTDLGVAYGINDVGDIIGIGSYWNGTEFSTQAFLLEPSTVPEPSTWALLLGGLGLLAFRRQRMQRTI